MSKYHISIMPKEVVEFLSPQSGGIFVDGTLGGGGHSKALLSKCRMKNLECRIIGIDLDKDAIEESKKSLKNFSGQVIFVQDNFANIKNILKKLQIPKASGILLDLGVSTHQLETPERGFSFNTEAKLDMRLGQNQATTAKEILNKYSEKNLREIFQKIGESPFAGRIVHEIVKTRAKTPIISTDQLVEIIKKSTPPKWRFSREKHFATNIFRALRMAVNQELENLEKIIPDAVDVLAPKGRLAIITFHSLEDRIVKKTFQKLENPCECPPKQPICTCGKKPLIKILTKKPILSTDTEILKNPKSRSAKLRVLEKL